MMTCSRVKPIAVILFFATLVAVGCTSVDDSLGAEFIPDDQQMSTRIVTLGEDGADPAFFTTRLAQKDSMPTSRSGALMLGSVYDPRLGHVSSGVVIQPVPFLEPADTSYFGQGAVADSMWLKLTLNTVSGKTLTDQSFTIYEMTDTIGFYKTLYADFDAAAIADMGRKLFTFTHSGTGSVNVRLTDAEHGQDYMDRLLERGLRYVDDSVFICGGENKDGETLDPFYGLYIVPDDAHADAAMYQFTANSSYSAMTLYAHNHDGQNPANVRDTLSLDYRFDDYYLYSNTVNCVSRDYSTGVVQVTDINFSPEAGNLGSTPEVATAWVQGMDGLYTQLTIEERLRERLAQLAGGRNMVIENATVYLEVEDPRPPLLDAGFTRLGMYLGEKRLAGIPDYDPSYEENYGAELPYGGYLIREPGYYSMNITTLVQRIAQGTKGYELPYTIALTPPDIDGVFSTSRIALKGSAADGGDYRIKLKLTYTLIP